MKWILNVLTDPRSPKQPGRGPKNLEERSVLHSSKEQQLILDRQDSSEMESNALLHPPVKDNSLLRSRSAAAHLPGISWCPASRVGGEWLSVGAAATSACSWRNSLALLQSKHTLVSNSKYKQVAKKEGWAFRQLSLQEFGGPAKIGRVGGRDFCGGKRRKRDGEGPLTLEPVYQGGLKERSGRCSLRPRGRP